MERKGEWRKSVEMDERRKEAWCVGRDLEEVMWWRIIRDKREYRK